ncbi:MAG: toxin [Legionellaceae bacterium]|nr:toxin [Legionellaceae bacterium]
MDDEQFDFSDEKNRQLIKERDISFDEVIAAIKSGKVLDIIPHPNIAKYPHQKLYVLLMNCYVYVVPFVKKDKGTIFLKTIFPHRKLTRKYVGSTNHVKKTDQVRS